MKRIITAILLGIAMLIPVAAVSVFTAAPAQAYTCVSKYKVGNADVNAVGFGAGSWDDTFRLEYRVCNEPNTTVCDETHCYSLYSTTAYAESYTVWHDYNTGTGPCVSTTGWEWNPNAIGGIDLVTKTRGCYTTIDQTIEWDFVDQRITQGMSDAQSCLGTTLTKVNTGADTTQSFPALCVTFTM